MFWKSHEHQASYLCRCMSVAAWQVMVVYTDWRLEVWNPVALKVVSVTDFKFNACLGYRGSSLPSLTKGPIVRVSVTVRAQYRVSTFLKSLR